MMPIVWINLFLYTAEAGENSVGVGKKDGEREIEEQIKTVGDGA
jgi:hypothetical protein